MKIAQLFLFGGCVHVVLSMLCAIWTSPRSVKLDTPQYQQALDSAILADNWLLHCAGHAEEYSLTSFDGWWRLASFDKGVIERFHEVHPELRLPSKDEIGERVRQLRVFHKVEVVGNKLVEQVLEPEAQGS